MAKLYEIVDDMLKIQELLEDDVDQEILNDTLEAVEGDFDDKIENYCKVIKNLESDIAGLKAEETRLAAKRKTMENNVKSIKTFMFNAMKTVNKTKSGGDLFTVAIQKNGGKIPVVLDVDEANLPADLLRIKKEADLDAIRELLEEGKGTEYAHFGERGESFRIK